MARGAPSPKGEARRHAILEAALDVFLEKGYERASLEEILARSGGSRTTIYTLFGGKEGLFETVITEGCQKIVEPFVAAGADNMAPEQALGILARSYLQHIATPLAIAFIRTVAAEGRRFPGIAQSFMRFGPDAILSALARYLDRMNQEGELRIPDPYHAAGMFLAMVRGEFMFDVLGLSVSECVPPTEAQVNFAVYTFLNGVRVN